MCLVTLGPGIRLSRVSSLPTDAANPATSTRGRGPGASAAATLDLSSLPATSSIMSVLLFPAQLPQGPLGTAENQVPPARTIPPPLSTLLTTQLPIESQAPGLPKPAALTISASLPPIPAKAVEKIRAGVFIDFKELLTDNIALLQRLQDVGQPGQHPLSALTTAARMRDIQDPLTWVFCFLAYMAARVDHEETRQLAAYGQIVIHLAHKHGGRGWLANDSAFRQQAAAGAA